MKDRKKGFTLLELLIVVIIIGVLASIALPSYVRTVEKSRWSEAVTNIGATAKAIDRHWYETGTSATASNWDVLDIDDPNDQSGRLYDYTFTDTSSAQRTYTVTAARRNPRVAYSITWTQQNNTSGSMQYPTTY